MKARRNETDTPAESGDLDVSPSKVLKYMPECRLIYNQAYRDVGLELVFCEGENGKTVLLYAHSIDSCRLIPGEMKNIQKQLKKNKKSGLG